METITTSKAREQLYHLIDKTAETHRPLQINGKRNHAVLIGKEDWDAIQETLYLQSIAGMRESIVTGMQTPVEDCAEGLDW